MSVCCCLQLIRCLWPRSVPRLLDAEDFDMPKPDRLSVITYLSEMYHAFKSGRGGGARKWGLASVAEPATAAKPAAATSKTTPNAQTAAMKPTPSTPKNEPKSRIKSLGQGRPCAKCGAPLDGAVAEFGGIAYVGFVFGFCVVLNRSVDALTLLLACRLFRM